MTALTIRVSGTVISSQCRFEAGGLPVVIVELGQAEGNTVRALHRYPDNSGSSGYAAKALASRLRGQHVDFDATNPRFKSRRMECDTAHFITDNTSTRKDLA